jgi:hypothetical protein
LYIFNKGFRTLKNINRSIPNHHLIAADFDNLGSKLEGINAPIVSKKLNKSHEKYDFNSYLVERGSVNYFLKLFFNFKADIFFPTDFYLFE